MDLLRTADDFIADVIASRVRAGHVLGKDLALHLPVGLSFTEFLARTEIIGFRDNFIMCAEAYRAYAAVGATKGQGTSHDEPPCNP